MSGPDVLAELQKDASTSRIPVVIVTGMSQKNEDQLLKQGAVGFLEKSVLELDKGSGKLLTAVAEILKRVSSNAAKGTTA